MSVLWAIVFAFGGLMVGLGLGYNLGVGRCAKYMAIGYAQNVALRARLIAAEKRLGEPAEDRDDANWWKDEA